jgi:hypothetical protein
MGKTKGEKILETEGSAYELLDADAEQEAVVAVAAPVVVLQPLPLAPPAKKEELPWYNCEDYWQVWIGMLWFVVIVILICFDVPIPSIAPWDNKEDLRVSYETANIVGFAIVMIATLITVAIVHYSMGKHQSILLYTLLCLLVIVCKIHGNNASMRAYGIGDSVVCIFVGVIVGNVFYPHRATVHAIFGLEFFIKVGVILLAIDMSQIGASLKGLVVAWASNYSTWMMWKPLQRHVVSPFVVVLPQNPSVRPSVRRNE